MANDWRRIYDALYMKKSAIVGKGLYTRVRIPKRAKIGEFGGERIGLREASRRARSRRIIAIVELDAFAYDASVGSNAFRCLPPAAEANSARTVARSRISFRSPGLRHLNLQRCYVCGG